MTFQDCFNYSLNCHKINWICSPLEYLLACDAIRPLKKNSILVWKTKIKTYVWILGKQITFVSLSSMSKNKWGIERFFSEIYVFRWITSN